MIKKLIAVAAVVLSLILIVLIIFRLRPTGVAQPVIQVGNNSPTLFPISIKPTADAAAANNGLLDYRQLTLLNSNQTVTLKQLQPNLPYVSSDFSVEYSPLLNQYVITKHTNQADAQISLWAQQHNLSGLISDQNLFPVETTQTVADKENIYQKNRELTLLSTPTAVPTTAALDNTDEGASLQELFASLFNIDVSGLTGTETVIPTPIPSPAPTTIPTQSSVAATAPLPLPTLTPTAVPSLIPTASAGGASSLTALMNEAAQKVGVPEKILEAVISIENPSAFNLSPEAIARQSTPGSGLTCPIASCSEQGPMQMTTGRDSNGRTDCPQCCWNGQCTGYCPNAWSIYGRSVNTYGGYTHTPNPCDLRDNIYAAALKLKTDSTATGATSWTQAEVNRAGLRYHGNCTYPYARLGNRTYCDYLWWYYQTQ
ncbi:hypothetical protein M1523_02560 [Patescibacteria group bacterium]|nr:hypothetical protein [Patescibacteria group bacterium]MCL5091397.1 hypothetical protein [Patescibacteria group bacterium]